MSRKSNSCSGLNHFLNFLNVAFVNVKLAHRSVRMI